MLFGIVGLVWYQSLHYYFFLVFFINVSLKPIIHPCRDSYDIEVCRNVTFGLLWLMELPVVIMLILSFSACVSLVTHYFPKLTFNLSSLIISYIGSLIFLLVYKAGDYGEFMPFYSLSVVITNGVILVLCFKLIKHLTNKGSG